MKGLSQSIRATEPVLENVNAEEDTIITSDNFLASSKNLSVLESDATYNSQVLGLIQSPIAEEKVARILLESFRSKVACRTFRCFVHALTLLTEKIVPTSTGSSEETLHRD